MIRLLVANGCSLTLGEELAHPETEAWPAVLASELCLPYINLARGGASNRRIVRTTVAEIGAICEAASARPNEVLVVILWTSCGRHELYVPAQRPRFFWRRHPIASDWADIGPWRLQEGHRPTRAFYDYLWTEEGQVTNLFLDWLMLDRFLEREGYAARYAFAIPYAPSIPEPAGWFARQLRPEKTFGGVPLAEGASFHEVIGERQRGPGEHPLADSHMLFAQMLAAWLRGGGAGLHIGS